MGQAEDLELLTSRVRDLEEQLSSQVQRIDPAIALGTQLYELGEVPSVRVGSGEAQTIGNNAFDQVVYAGLVWGDSSMWIIANPTRLVAPVRGIYLVTGHVQWVANTTGIRRIALNHTDSTATTTTFAQTTIEEPSGATPHFSIAGVFSFDLLDYVEVVVFQNSGGDLNIANVNRISAEATMTMIAPFP